MGDKNFIWNLLKDDIEMVIEQGRNCGYDSETSDFYGKFEAYEFILDKMKQLEGGYINE
ncbi:MAG: hypothetical protein GX025_10335 [Clostridiales bacterium]|nr:hypothetical protein [Clostridiales bacterium]